MQRKLISLLFSVKNNSIIMRAHCDVCNVESVCVYVHGLDRWMCELCVKTVAILCEPTFD